MAIMGKLSDARKLSTLLFWQAIYFVDAGEGAGGSGSFGWNDTSPSAMVRLNRSAKKKLVFFFVDRLHSDPMCMLSHSRCHHHHHTLTHTHGDSEAIPYIVSKNVKFNLAGMQHCHTHTTVGANWKKNVVEFFIVFIVVACRCRRLSHRLPLLPRHPNTFIDNHLLVYFPLHK